MVTGKTDIVIAAIDRPDETLRTIKTLFEVNENIRVILIHDGSTVKPDLSSYKDVIQIDTGGRLGQAKTVNVGLDLVRSEYVVVMHNDIIIKDKGWIDKAVSFLKDNPEAGLVADLGWQLKDGRLPYIPISSVMEGGYFYSSIPMTEDFVEVYNTDNIINIFKSGIRADERYGLGSLSFWIDIKAKGLKVYVMKFKNGEHIHTSSRDLKAYTDLTSWEEERNLMNDVVIKRMTEFNIEMPKPELK